MKVRLFKIGSWYIRLDVPLVVTELLLGLATVCGAYQACTDTSFTDCKAYFFNEIEIGLLLFNICIGKETELSNEQLEQIKNNG